MKKTRFTQEQIVKIVRQQEAGLKVGEIEIMGSVNRIFYNWEAEHAIHFGGNCETVWGYSQRR